MPGDLHLEPVGTVLHVVGSTRARRYVARVSLGLAQRDPHLDPVASGSRWRDTMSKQPKPTVPRLLMVVVVKIDLQRIRWIEPRPRSGEWWPLPRPQPH
jgi:hypothetical protein